MAKRIVIFLAALSTGCLAGASEDGTLHLRLGARALALMQAANASQPPLPPAPALEQKSPAPQLTQSGKLLLSETFDGEALPPGWQAGGRAHCFRIVAGALQGACPPDDGHGPAVTVPLTGHNLTIAFDLQYKQKGGFLFLVNGESQFGGEAHLVRVGLGRGGITVQQDRGNPKSKLAQKVEKDRAAKEKRKLPPATPAQLADPEFYRIEHLASAPGKLDDGRWHHVLVEINGNDILAQVDGNLAAGATATVADVKKSTMNFLVGQAGTVLIDNVKVWENELSPHASAVKAKWPQKAKTP